MEIHFNQDLQAKLAIDTGRAPDELVEDVVAAYLSELAQARETLNRRYDDLKSGTVKPIPGDDVQAHFRDKSAARRSQPDS
jgi:hypothetical protein